MPKPIIRQTLCSCDFCPAPNDPFWHFCLVCQDPMIQHHHVISRGMGGSKSRRMDKQQVIPLCITHHDQISLNKYTDEIVDGYYIVTNKRGNVIVRRQLAAPLKEGFFEVEVQPREADNGVLPEPTAAALTRDARYRARKRGEDVPFVKAGPKPGFKQPPEHVEKRKRWGENHHSWKGDAVGESRGRQRANELYVDIGPCSVCGSEPAERHHIDGNTVNNEPENIAVLCRRCHMQEDGRLESFRKVAHAHQSEPPLTFSEWEEKVKSIGTFKHSLGFLIGDLVILGEDAFGEQAWQYLSELGYEDRSIGNMVRVCRAIPPARRRDTLTYSHHVVVYKLPESEQEEWLDQADGLTVKAFRELVHGPPKPRVKRYSIEELRARFVECVAQLDGEGVTIKLPDFLSWLEAQDD